MNIIDPKTKESFNINSNKGIKLIRNYLKYYLGGNRPIRNRKQTRTFLQQQSDMFKQQIKKKLKEQEKEKEKKEQEEEFYKYIYSELKTKISNEYGDYSYMMSEIENDDSKNNKDKKYKIYKKFKIIIKKEPKFNIEDIIINSTKREALINNIYQNNIFQSILRKIRMNNINVERKEISNWSDKKWTKFLLDFSGNECIDLIINFNDPDYERETARNYFEITGAQQQCKYASKCGIQLIDSSINEFDYCKPLKNLSKDDFSNISNRLRNLNKGTEYFKSKKKNTNLPICYLCGEKCKKNIKQPELSPECEHIIPALKAIFMVGIFQSNNILNELNLNDNDKIHLTLIYDWAHSICNRIKSDKFLIEFDTSENKFIFDEKKAESLFDDIHTSYKGGLFSSIRNRNIWIKNIKTKYFDVLLKYINEKFKKENKNSIATYAEYAFNQFQTYVICNKKVKELIDSEIVSTQTGGMNPEEFFNELNKTYIIKSNLLKRILNFKRIDIMVTDNKDKLLIDLISIANIIFHLNYYDIKFTNILLKNKIISDLILRFTQMIIDFLFESVKINIGDIYKYEPFIYELLTYSISSIIIKLDNNGEISRLLNRNKMINDNHSYDKEYLDDLKSGMPLINMPYFLRKIDNKIDIVFGIRGVLEKTRGDELNDIFEKLDNFWKTNFNKYTDNYAILDINELKELKQWWVNKFDSKKSISSDTKDYRFTTKGANKHLIKLKELINNRLNLIIKSEIDINERLLTPIDDLINRTLISSSSTPFIYEQFELIKTYDDLINESTIEHSLIETETKPNSILTEPNSILTEMESPKTLLDSCQENCRKKGTKKSICAQMCSILGS